MLAPAGPEYSSEYYAGQAEVEVIDPNQYEEMLRLLAMTPSGVVRYATTTPVPPSALVTLLPPKSNSGFKSFRPKVKLHQGASLLTKSSISSSSSSSLAAHNQHSTTDEGREMSESLKLMNANNGHVEAVVVGGGGGDSGDNGRAEVVEAAALMAESGDPGFENQNDNKNNMEAVVRASMRFES